MAIFNREVTYTTEEFNSILRDSRQSNPSGEVDFFESAIKAALDKGPPGVTVKKELNRYMSWYNKCPDKKRYWIYAVSKTLKTVMFGALKNVPLYINHEVVWVQSIAKLRLRRGY